MPAGRPDKWAKALKLKREGMTYVEIANHVGFSNGGNARQAVLNGMKAEGIEDAEEVLRVKKPQATVYVGGSPLYQIDFVELGKRVAIALDNEAEGYGPWVRPQVWRDFNEIEEDWDA